MVSIADDIPVIQWDGCYKESWLGTLVPAAFSHPAKVAPGLSYRIYRHMLDKGYIQTGDSIGDPFGGIGGFGYYAMLLGLHFTAVELEPRFVALANENIEKWQRDLVMLGDALGTARVVQGDSRQFAAVVGGLAGVISSPPFGEQQTGGGIAASLKGQGDYQITTDRPAANSGYVGQADSPGNLAALRADDTEFSAVVSSPPYATGKDRAHPSLGSVNHDDWGEDGHSIAARRGLSAAYGDTPGQIADMPEGAFAAVVSSPPYADAVAGSGEGPGARWDFAHHNPDTAVRQTSDNRYGVEPGNLGNLAGDGYEAVVSSPPYENSLESRGDGIDWEKTTTVHRGSRTAGRGAIADGYGAADGNIGNDTGETFWSAAKLIVEQVYIVLRPGGYAVFVTKDYVRRGERVPFSDQWQQLCAAVGFEPVERIHAMLVEEHGEQLDIFGGATVKRKERKSFFRRLAERKGSPRIDWEDVIILRKPESTEES